MVCKPIDRARSVLRALVPHALTTPPLHSLLFHFFYSISYYLITSAEERSGDGEINKAEWDIAWEHFDAIGLREQIWNTTPGDPMKIEDLVAVLNANDMINGNRVFSTFLFFIFFHYYNVNSLGMRIATFICR
jgi:hypothetical protein